MTPLTPDDTAPQLAGPRRPAHTRADCHSGGPRTPPPGLLLPAIRFSPSEPDSSQAISTDAPVAITRCTGRHLATTLSLFEPGGALHGRVKVSITDKAYMAVCKVVDLVIEEDAELHESGAARQIARDLFAEGPRAYGMETWNRLLSEFVSFVRTTRRKGVKTPLEQLLATIDDLRLVSPQASGNSDAVAVARPR